MPALERVDASSAVRELAAELHVATPELAHDLNEHLFATIPELAERDDADLREETRASCEANIDQILRLLKQGAGTDAIAVPVEAAGWARSLVRRGITLAALLRAYRLGHAWVWDRWSRALRDRPGVADPVAAQDESSAFMFAYIDRVSDELVGEYGSERERMVRSAAQLRAETVRAMLAGDAIDEEVAAGRLGYELRRTHVALRLSAAGSELRGLERAATEAAAVLGAREPLIVAAGVATIDVWCGGFELAADDALDAFEPPAGIRVAVGGAGDGIAGFRRSHAEARQAARIATLAGGDAASVTRYACVELVSLLAGDLPRAREFVARQLGPLASPSEQAERLRETALAFLLAAGSATRAAKDLFVHQNTVAYRVKRAEELLGRRVSDEPAELLCALVLAAVLGEAVLADG